MIIIGIMSAISMMITGYSVSVVGSHRRYFHEIATGGGLQNILYEQSTRTPVGWFLMFFGLFMAICGYFLAFILIQYCIKNRSKLCLRFLLD